MIKQRLLLPLCFLLSACVMNTDKPADPRDKDVVVLVPGFKGTSLVTESGKIVWVDAYEALLGRKRLMLSSEGLEIDSTLELGPGALLRNVSLKPLYTYEIYGGWISALRSAYGEEAAILPFGYDWRREPVEAAASLEKTLREVRAAGARSVTLVAHSMGALVSSYLLRYGSQPLETARETWEGLALVDAAVLAGAPYRGAAVMFRDMQTGVSTGLNRSLLDGGSLSSFPSSYSLLSNRNDPTLRLSSGEEVDIFDATEWRRQKWGLFRESAGVSGPTADQIESFVSRQLERGKLMQDKITAPLSRMPERKIPVLSIVGVALSTPQYFEWPSETPPSGGIEQLVKELPERTRYAAGDGVVLASSAGMPEAYREALKPEIVETSAEHLSLLGEEKVIEALRRFSKEGA